MRMTGFYPVVATEDVAIAATFWTDHMGFEETFAADWYVSLRRPGPPDVELAFLRFDHPTVPEPYRRPVAGVLLNVEVDDVDAEWDRLVTRGGCEVALPLRSETFGQRHFILAAPGGVLVDVITEIPPGEEFAAAFTSR